MFLSVAMVAERWQCQDAFVLKMIKKGALPVVYFGKLMRLRLEDVEAFEEVAGETPTKKPSSVYVVRAGPFVKIGKAIDVGMRLFGLQNANPLQLEVLAVLTGDGHVLERELHARFTDYRERGEWFRIEGDLQKWIESGCAT